MDFSQAQNWFLNLSGRKKQIGASIAFVIAGAAILIGYSQMGPNALTYAEAEGAFSKWYATPADEALYLNMKEAIRSVPALQKKYEAEARLRKLFGDAPARRDMADTVGTNEYLKPLISEAPDMKSSLFVSRTIDGESGINARLEKYLKDAVNALNKGVGADTAIQPVDNGLHQVLDGYKAASAATNK